MKKMTAAERMKKREYYRQWRQKRALKSTVTTPQKPKEDMIPMSKILELIGYGQKYEKLKDFIEAK